jgi:DNA-binding transcriptional ArsR family regulator
MKTQTRQKIVDFVAAQNHSTAKAIIEHVGLTPPAVFRHLAKLVSDGVLTKQGTPPKVFYRVAHAAAAQDDYAFKPEVERLINERFLKVMPNGTLHTGKQAFIRWCLARKEDPIKTSLEYAASIKKFDAYKQDGLINGLPKLQRALATVYVDELYYLDFYSIERFGKTKLGELVLYAKQSQNTTLMRLIAADVREAVLLAIKRFRIDAVGYVPPTVKRERQFMKELEKLLRLPIPSIAITKIRTPIIVPQKTLSKLEERIENARQSLVVEEQKTYRNILLIDDALGSGATINEIASQMRAKNMCTGKIIGLALTGSFSGFDVIQEA